MTNEEISDNQFIAPMSGTVIEIFVEPNQSVKKSIVYLS